MSFHKGESQNASSASGDGMPWLICIVACLEGRDKGDKCGDGKILDHIWKGQNRPGWFQLSWIWKRVEAGTVLSSLQRWGRGSSEDLGTGAPLPAWQPSRQMLAPVFYWIWEMEYSLLPCPLVSLTSISHPPLAASVLYLPSISTLLSLRYLTTHLNRMAHFGLGGSWTQLFLSTVLPSSLPQTHKNAVTQNTEWQGQLAGQQQQQFQSCEQLLPFFAVHSYQMSAKQFQEIWL